VSKLQSSECSRGKGSKRDAIPGFTWALTPSVPRIVGQRIRTPPGRKRRVRKVQGLSRRKVLAGRYQSPAVAGPGSARWYELLRNARDCRPTVARDDRSGSRGRSECELRVGCGNAAQGIEIPDSRSLRDEWCVCAMRGRRVSLSWERASAAQAATSTPSGSGGRARHHGHSVRRGAGRQAALRARPRTSLTRRPRPGRAEPSGARSSRG